MSIAVHMKINKEGARGYASVPVLQICLLDIYKQNMKLYPADISLKH